MVRDIFLGRITDAIIEVKKDTTDKQIAMFEEIYPGSIVLREDDERLLKLQKECGKHE